MKARSLDEMVTRGAKRRRKKGHLSAHKAREILHDGTVHGKPITKKQRGYFGAVASGSNRK
jgi:hypothetical protein